MSPAVEEPGVPAGRSRLGLVTAYALLGAASGTTAVLIVEFLPDWLLPEPLVWLLLSPASLLPGLVFGLVIGAALRRRGLIGWARFVAYTVAATVSYLAAFAFATQVLLAHFMHVHLVIGALAGLFGSFCLTGLSLPLLPFLRRVRPCLGLLVVGTMFGALLPLVTRPYGVLAALLFFALWQGSYAAVLSMAFPPRRATPAAI